ncbi:cytochrome c [Methylomarinum sp. Ch1-1]|uniref:Cytochrome c n=1 Tax=Methylomarinum roseum TaxID=3067653 RepID=A0AAU7NQP1_9GAMM|nr:cytochrome c [Methylomarinum sp. Ch1-1]MDP4520741.1 cytochrome c [Methylomarinum sp. Ch1-1]
MKPLTLMWIYCSLLLISSADAGAETAKDNYKTYCVQCHGMEGNGKGINVADMSTQPRDHTDAKEMSARTDAELFKVIKEGGQSINKSVLMPPWGSTLSDEEIEGLVNYLHQLCQC